MFVSSELESEVSSNEYQPLKRKTKDFDFYFGFLHREGYTVKKG